MALTDTERTRAADELAHFKKVLKYHKNIIFADEKYLMNKSRQERLHFPTRIPAEQDIQKLRNFTVVLIELVDVVAEWGYPLGGFEMEKTLVDVVP